MPDPLRARHAALGAGAVCAEVARAGVRMGRGLAAPIWRTWPVRPLADEVERAVGELAARGRREEARLRDEATNAVTGTLVEQRLVDRVAAQLLADGLVDRIIASPELDAAIQRTLENPAFDGLVARLVDAPGVERASVRVLESHLVDELTGRILASEELHRVVVHVAESPEVRAALTAQSAGLVDEVADGMRARTVTADAFVERLARRALRRPPRSRE
jgi:hypothetical protein